jgi:hypothetical protein
MASRTRQYTLALVLLTISLLSLQPAPTIADKQPTQNTLSINATGQASPIRKGKGQGPLSAVTLSLNGTSNRDENGQLKVYQLTGTLEIGATTYAISEGYGDANKDGKLEINSKASDGSHEQELILNGNVQGNTISFNSPESKLASTYFLTLSGQITSKTRSTNTSQRDNENESENEISPTGETNDSQSEQNDTVTQTVTRTVTQNNTSTQLSNRTIILTLTKTISNATITETVTTTLANETVTNTVTTTVANTTITVPHT